MKLSILATIVTVLIASVAVAEETAPFHGNFVLSVDRGTPGAEEMLRGDYADAIAIVNRYSNVSSDLSAQHTLCAANIALANFADAEIACERAIKLARKIITTPRQPHGHRNREGMAKAYSNRAVLRALQGDTNAANDDLLKAERQNRERETIRKNLETNETRSQLARLQKLYR